jgi:hypothetical protein
MSSFNEPGSRVHRPKEITEVKSEPMTQRRKNPKNPVNLNATSADDDSYRVFVNAWKQLAGDDLERFLLACDSAMTAAKEMEVGIPRRTRSTEERMAEKKRVQARNRKRRQRNRAAGRCPDHAQRRSRDCVTCHADRPNPNRYQPNLSSQKEIREFIGINKRSKRISKWMKYSVTSPILDPSFTELVKRRVFDSVWFELEGDTWRGLEAEITPEIRDTCFAEFSRRVVNDDMAALFRSAVRDLVEVNRKMPLRWKTRPRKFFFDWYMGTAAPWSSSAGVPYSPAEGADVGQTPLGFLPKPER